MRDTMHGARRGQSVIELLVAIAVGAVFVVGAAAALAPALRSRANTVRTQTAAVLGRELFEHVRVFAEANWSGVAHLPPGSANRYYVSATSSPFSVVAGTEQLTIATTTYLRYFTLQPISRSATGTIAAGAGTTNDSSTKLVTVVFGLVGGPTSSVTTYLTRWPHRVYIQTDWSGGSGQAGPVTSTNNRYAVSANVQATSVVGSVYGPTGGAATGTLDSTTFDTGIAAGAQYHAILWNGATVATSGEVGIQLATSNDSGGPWTFLGPGGNPASLYVGPPGTSITVDRGAHYGQRYLRYRLTLATTTPRLDEIVIVWSR